MGGMLSLVLSYILFNEYKVKVEEREFYLKRKKWLEKNNMLDEIDLMKKEDKKITPIPYPQSLISKLQLV